MGQEEEQDPHQQKWHEAALGPDGTQNRGKSWTNLHADRSGNEKTQK